MGLGGRGAAFTLGPLGFDFAQHRQTLRPYSSRDPQYTHLVETHAATPETPLGQQVSPAPSLSLSVALSLSLARALSLSFSL